MSLQRYSKRFWFPNGSPAVNIEARVFFEDSAAFVPLFTDATGAVPMANPTVTDGFGVLTFWAESGDYWAHLDTEAFPIPIGMTQEQADLSTGVASGGKITVNAGNPLAVDITALDGYIVDYLADTQAQPSIVRIKAPAQTVALDAAALTRTATWFLMDAAGTIIQQAFPADNIQRRTHISIGAAAQDGVQIFRTLSDSSILAQPVNQLADLMDGLGLFLIRPMLVTPNANLTFNTAATTVFARSLNRYSGALLTNNPHNVMAPAAAPAQFRYITRSSTTFGPLRTTVDVANYDVGGVITPIGGGTNTASVHRLWVAGTGNAADQFAFQYGQNTYASLSAAVNAIGQTNFVVNPVLQGATALAAWIVAIRTATNLSDPSQAAIIPAGKFAAP